MNVTPTSIYKNKKPVGKELYLRDVDMLYIFGSLSIKLLKGSVFRQSLLLHNANHGRFRIDGYGKLDKETC